MRNLAKRIFDLFFSVTGLIIFSPLLAALSLVILLTLGRPILYSPKRTGVSGNLFTMRKFRTMTPGTGTSSHHSGDDDPRLTQVGRWIRKFKLDELPQLWNIAKGEMSFVGPRPALYNQEDLIALRTEKGVEKLLPGITGWAQVNGRDELSIPDKVALDVEYLNRQSFWFDMKILWMTFLKVMKRDGVKH